MHDYSLLNNTTTLSRGFKYHSGTTTSDRILVNDTWGENGDAETIRQAAQTVSAFALDGVSSDAAPVVTLPPGAYT